MPLMSGTRIGSYEIAAPLGVGGMGEVYRARDMKLNREVALKILPTEFALDPDRLARFKREAQVLASLNHPNIAAIYGFEDADATHALVLELVEGPTLAERIERGALPVDEALAIARQMAEALEAAHEQGVIHRDLKPANIKVRPDGSVKVLDFGLAKALDPPSASLSGERTGGIATMSPTITSPAMTQAGVILGTAAYMSPEQAKGRPADKRSDVWAFGCVLFEMLTGRRAFEGEDVSDTLAFVLTKEPDWALLPSATPSSIRRLLQRSLQKDRKRRLADVADVRLEIDEGLAASAEPTPLAAAWTPALHWRRTAIVALAALILGGVVGAAIVLNRSAGAPAPVTRFAFSIPADQPFIEFGHQVLAISRDGGSIAYVANRRIYIRSMSDTEARPIAGTEMPSGQLGAPAFSPDGKSIAFLASTTLMDRSIRVVPISGGAPVSLCDACNPAGSLSWDERGIVFVDSGLARVAAGGAQSDPRIMRVSPAGGEPAVLATISGGRPWDAQLLPDGEHLLFTLAARVATSDPSQTSAASWDRAAVVVQSLKSGARKTIINGGLAARYVPSGHVVYARSGVLFAARFDLRTLEVTGPSTPVIQGVRRPSAMGGFSMSGTVYFAVSDSGSLVYASGPKSFLYRYDLALLDQQSGLTPLKLQPAGYGFPRVSPDGRWVAVDVDDGSSANIFICDLSGATALRQLTSRGRNRFPVWSPDNASVSFQSDRDGDFGIFRQPSNGTRDAERLTKADPGTTHVPDAGSPDGKTLLFEESRQADRVLKAFVEGDKEQSIVGDIHETYPLDATFSPDGRFIAFRAPGGRSTVVVRPFPITSARFPVAEGVYPVWSPNGKSLIFRRLTTGEFVVTDVTASAGFAFSPPRQLPKNFPDAVVNSGRRSYDILPDGRLLGVVAVSDTPTRQGAPELQVVLNWSEELKQRVPVR
jgi:eukaryotic-like serine/threonine-protein kinase